MMKAQLIHAKADLRFTLQNYNFPTNPQGDGGNSVAMYWHWLFVFTRITVNVPRIVINCLGDIASGCRWLQ
jgi:hypothetical protein